MQAVWRKTAFDRFLAILAVFGFAGLFIFFFVWRLGSLTPGISQFEAGSRAASHSLHAAIDHGVNLPYAATQRLSLAVFDQQATALRAASVFWALLVLCSLLLLLRNLFGFTISLAAGLIFIATPWVVLTARSGSPNIMYFWPIVCAALFSLMAKSKNLANLWWLSLCASVAISLYTPGMIWAFMVVIIFGWTAITRVMQKSDLVSLSLGVLLMLAILAPLGRALYFTPAVYKEILLVPAFMPNWLESLKSIGWSLSTFFWRSQGHIDISLGRLPILNLMQVALAFFGAYALSARSRRLTYLLLSLVVLAAVSSGVSNQPAILSLGLIALTFFAASGLRYLMLEWHRVFPRNPIAKVLAVVLICGVVAMQILYGARYSLAAWPNSAEVQQSYVLK